MAKNPKLEDVKNNMSIDYMTELMNNNQSVTRFTDSKGTKFGIAILSRGETLFFQQDNKSLICEIDAVNAVIFTKTIREWHDGKKIKPSERDLLVKNILFYYGIVYNKDVKVHP